MSTTTQTVTYPYVTMNHLALMLTMLKHRIRFPKQVEKLVGGRIHVLNPAMCPDNNTQIAVFHPDRYTAYPIKIYE